MPRPHVLRQIPLGATVVIALVGYRLIGRDVLVQKT